MSDSLKYSKRMRVENIESKLVSDACVQQNAHNSSFHMPTFKQLLSETKVTPVETIGLDNDVVSTPVSNAEPIAGTSGAREVADLRFANASLEPMQVLDEDIPSIQNIVCTASLGCKLDLKQIAKHAVNAEYNPKRFNAVIMRIRRPNTTALMFSSGKMVCIGAKTRTEAWMSARKFARIVQKIGFEVEFSEFKIQNIVASCNLGQAIYLEGLCHSEHGPHVTYNPEIFPGLLYTIRETKIVFLVFASGKVVLTGAKNLKQISDSFDAIKPVLKSAKRKWSHN